MRKLIAYFAASVAIVIGSLGATECAHSLSFRPLVFGKDTTYITHLRRPSGMPDYQEYFRQAQLAGHPPNKNILTRVLEVAGARLLNHWSQKLVPDTLTVLAAHPPSSQFVFLNEFAKELTCPDDGNPYCAHRLASETVRSCEAGVWTSETLEMANKWVRENEKLMPAIIDAYQRPALFIPVHESGNGTLDPLRYMDIARLLHCAGALDVESDRSSRQIEIVNALWKYGCVTGPEHGVVVYNVGLMAQKWAVGLLYRALNAGLVDSTIVRNMLALDEWRPKPVDYTRVIHFERIERLMFAFVWLHLGRNEQPEFIDANRVLRHINHVFDMAEAAVEGTSLEEFIENLRSLEKLVERDPANSDDAASSFWCRMPGMDGACRATATDIVAKQFSGLALANAVESLGRSAFERNQMLGQVEAAVQEN